MTKRCTATAKSTGERCKNPARPGYNVCRFHGAGKIGGPAGGRPPTHGRYSKFLPSDLLDRYQEARNDPELLELRDELALLDVRAQELAGRLTEGGEGARIEAALEALVRARVARRRVQAGEDADQARVDLDQALEAIEANLTAANVEARIWEELAVVWEQRRRLVDTERRRLVDLQQYVTAQQALALVRVVVDIVRRHVTDRRTLAAIAADVRGATNGDRQKELAGKPHER